MRRPPFSQLLPGTFELWYIAIASGLLILVGNGRLILQQLGIVGSTKLIGQQVSLKLDPGLNSLQSFRFSANAADLVVWGVVGLVIYSMLEAVVRSLRELEFKRDFNSSLYIHPREYSSTNFWQEVAIDTVLGFMLLVGLVAGGILYVVAAIPSGFALIRRFIIHPGFISFFEFLIGVALVFAATAVVYLLLRAVVRHHRVSQYIE